MADYKDLLQGIQQTPPRGLNDHIVLVDGMNTLIRSFTMIKSLNPSGSHTGGLVGFLRSTGFVNRILDPTRLIVVWDGKGGSGNRQNLDPNYKAQRANSRITHWGLYDTKEEETEALVAQIYRTQDYLDTLPIHQIMMEKLEADDIIAYLAKQGSSKGKQVTIVSSDKDFLQLINENIHVYSPIKKITYTPKEVEAELGMLAENYNLAKCLIGDKSDNLEGVRGMGMKTIIKEFPKLVTDKGVTLDYIYEESEKRMHEKKIFAKVLHQWDRVEINYQLMDLHNTVLDEKEIKYVQQVLSQPIPKLQSGAFLRLLDQDNIEGITKNTELWLDGFNNLTITN